MGRLERFPSEERRKRGSNAVHATYTGRVLPSGSKHATAQIVRPVTSGDYRRLTSTIPVYITGRLVLTPRTETVLDQAEPSGQLEVVDREARLVDRTEAAIRDRLAEAGQTVDDEQVRIIRMAAHEALEQAQKEGEI
jgi:hypothetical protein